jgi:hypothetical protein
LFFMNSFTSVVIFMIGIIKLFGCGCRS